MTLFCAVNDNSSYHAYRVFFIHKNVQVRTESNNLRYLHFTWICRATLYMKIKLFDAKYNSLIKRYAHIWRLIFFFLYRSVWNMLYTPKIVFWFYFVLVNLDVHDILKDIIAELFFVSLFIYNEIKVLKFVCLGKRVGAVFDNRTHPTPTPTHPLPLGQRMIILK